MSRPQEHDYLGLSEASSMECSDKISSASPALIVEDFDRSRNLNLKETELRLGLPGSESPERKIATVASVVCGQGKGSDVKGPYTLGVLKSFVSGAKRGLSKTAPEKKPLASSENEHAAAPASKAQVVGWPPIRSFRKNTMAVNLAKNGDDVEDKLAFGCLYVKVGMDGAPYLRKVDLKVYSNYVELSSALEKMFSCFTIGQYGSHGVPGREGLTESCLMDLLHGSEYVLTYEDKDGDWMLVGDVPWEMFIGSCKKLRIMKGSEAIGLAPRAMEKCKSRS